MTHILTIDLGTTNYKASLFEETGDLVASRSTPAPCPRRPDGRHEIDADTFIDTVAGLVRDLEAGVPGGFQKCGAVTFSTQTNSFILLDAEDRPLTPIVVWDDSRANAIRDEIVSALNASGLYETTGVPELSPAFMAAKLFWYQRDDPDLFARVARVCLISDFFTLWMTGRFVTEAGAAGLTGFVDIHRLCWREDALERFGLRHDWMPELVRAGTDLGAIRPDIAKRLNLPKECRFVVGCLDQYAGAIGAGNVAPGGLSETTGTVLATVRCTDEFDAEVGSGVFYGPAHATGLYSQMVFGGISANLLEFYRGLLDEAPDFHELDELAAQIAPGAGGLRLPVDQGEDYLHELIRSWSKTQEPGKVTRAILEGVAFALREQVAALSGGIWPDEIVCVGGAARSELWRAIKANVLGIPTVALECAEPTSLGAALLAMGALSGRPLPELTAAFVKRGQIARPDDRLYTTYAAMAVGKTE